MPEILILSDRNVLSAQLLEKCAMLAEAIKRPLRLLHFVEAHLPEATRTELLTSLEKPAQILADRGLDVSCEIQGSSDPIADLIERCREGRIALVVKATHETGDAPSLEDWKLIRQLPCALLFVETKPWSTKPRFLATVDLDESSEQQERINSLVLQGARQWTDALQGTLEVAYIIPIAKPLEALDIVDAGRVVHEKGDESEQALKALLARHNAVADSTHIDAGNPSERISSRANKQKVDVCLVGSVGRKGVKGILLGNTAEKMIQALRCDVLIVKP